MESGPLADPDFPALAEDFVLYCSIDHQVEGRPYGALRADLKLTGLPSVAYLDADGTVLVTVPHDRRDVAGLRASGARAHEVLRLRAAAPEDPRAAAAYLMLQFEERQLSLAAAEARRAALHAQATEEGVALDPELLQRIDARVLDLRIAARLATTRGADGRVDDAAYQAAGRDFLERLRHGPHPSRHVSRGYWYAMFAYAEAARDVDGFRLALDDFSASLEVTAVGALWVAAQLQGYGDTLYHMESVAAVTTPELQERAARAVAAMDLRPGMVVADIGCAGGSIAWAVAEQVGAAGRVYAVDIRGVAIDRVRALRLANLIAVLSQPDDVSLPAACLDLAFLHDVASHVAGEAQPGFYASIARALKPGGSLLVFLHHGQGAAYLAQLRGYGFVPRDPAALEGLDGEALDARLRAGVHFVPRGDRPSR